MAGLVAFGSGRIGLMWSQQHGTSEDGFYVSVHADGAPSDRWSAATPVFTGARAGDDHINLKGLHFGAGRVFAVVKTSYTSATHPLVMLLAPWRAVAPGQATIASVAEGPNRVILLIDEAAQLLRSFATYPKPEAPGTTTPAATRAAPSTRSPRR